MTKPCLFCKMPIRFDDTGMQQWEYEGQSLPCHAMCGDFMASSLRNYEPVDTSYTPAGYVPKVWAWVGVTFEQYRTGWIYLPDRDKAFYFEKYSRILERTLDHQSHEVRAYCKRAGLPEPEIVREIKQSNRLLTEMKYILTHKAGPGDHLVIPQFPRSRTHDNPGAAQYVRRLAMRAAKGGVTLHMAYLCLDWSKPICQAAVNLSVAASTWVNEIRDANMAYEKGYVERLYGIRWCDLKDNKLFLWIITNIRDQKMTPIEVAEASKKYCTVIGWTGFRSFVMMLTRNRREATRFAHEEHFFCKRCKLVVCSPGCPKCRGYAYKIKVAVIKRMAFSARMKDKTPFEETVARCWAFYCQMHPDQEKLPWMTRSRLP